MEMSTGVSLLRTAQSLLTGRTILGQVATLRSFQLESILECPALDVRHMSDFRGHRVFVSHSARTLPVFLIP